MHARTLTAAIAAVVIATSATSASAQIQFLQDYETATAADRETNNQLFLRRPGLSGSNLNVPAGNANNLTLVSPGLGPVGGTQALQVLVGATTAGEPQRTRFLVDSDGNVDLNLPNSGTIGFLLNVPDTAPDDLVVGFAVEDTGRANLEVLGPTSVTSNGTTRLYQFNLGPGTQTMTFSEFFGGSGLGDGSLTNATFNPDSIVFRTLSATSDFNFTIDSIAFNPNGDLSALIPEPASLGLLAFAGLGLLARRRRA